MSRVARSGRGDCTRAGEGWLRSAPATVPQTGLVDPDL